MAEVSNGSWIREITIGTFRAGLGLGGGNRHDMALKLAYPLASMLNVLTMSIAQ
jgi:hypothetical protein